MIDAGLGRALPLDRGLGLWRYLVSSARYSDLLIEYREIFIPHPYLAPRSDPVGIS